MSLGIPETSSIIRKLNGAPQYDWLWKVELPGLLDPPDPTGQGVVSNYINRYLMDRKASIRGFYDSRMVHEHLSHRVYEITTPYTQFDTQKSIDKASFRYAAERSDIGTISMTIDEFEDGSTLDYLLAWQSLIQNQNGTRNPPAVYKRPIIFSRISGTKIELHQSKYIGYFPTEISPMANSQEGSGITQFSVTFTGDDVEHTIRDMRSETTDVMYKMHQETYRSDGNTLDDIDAVQRRKILDRVLASI